MQSDSNIALLKAINFTYD